MIKKEYSQIVIAIYCIETSRNRDLKVKNFRNAQHLEETAFNWSKCGYDIADVDFAPEEIHSELCKKNYSLLFDNSKTGLKTLEEKSLKRLIRKRLMYTPDEIYRIYVNSLGINTDASVRKLLSDMRASIKTHKRFDMSGDNDHEDLLSYFDYLGLRNAFIKLDLTFHKGCGSISYKTKSGKQQSDIGLCGHGTIDIIYLIFKVAFDPEYYLYE